MTGHAIFWSVLGVWLFLDAWLNLFYNRRISRNLPEKKSKYVLSLIIILGVGLGMAVSEGARESWLRPFTVLRHAGTALIVLGIAVRCGAVWQLRKYFTANLGVQPGQKIIKTGLFRLIRHPAYAGDMICFLGVGLAFSHPVSSALAVILPFAAFLYRMRLEEKILIRSFGSGYRDYMKKTARIIPFIF